MNAPLISEHPGPITAPPAFGEQALMSMLNYMEHLSTVYSEELNAIEGRDMKRFSELQDVKNRLVMDCESTMKEIRKKPDSLKTVSPALNERVAIAESHLQQLATRSQHACRIRSESIKRLQDRLLEAARSMISKNQTKYNSSGKTDLTKNRPVATAINEAI